MSKERIDLLQDFDEWVEVTGALPKGTSYHAECRSFIEDAMIHIRFLASKVIERNKENSKLIFDAYLRTEDSQ